ncbi:MAG TPA: septation protein SepH, partial [Lapillicoccus sp.]|nr:septation protein SepH [Lapillicoccus sp.]
MQDLRLIGVQDDGEHLLLSGADGEHYRLPLDESLRAAARRDRPRLGQLQIEMEGGMRPREVQTLIRAGATAEEVAERAGWTVEKVRKYEGPIIAERVHVAEQARLVRVRSRGGSSGSASPPTLQGRVTQRMRERGVDPESNAWDSWRGIDETHWTVVLTFAAGGRQRQALWSYDPVLRSVEAVDDEARWLSADEP